MYQIIVCHGRFAPLCTPSLITEGRRDRFKLVWQGYCKSIATSTGQKVLNVICSVLLIVSVLLSLSPERYKDKPGRAARERLIQKLCICVTDATLTSQFFVPNDRREGQIILKLILFCPEL